MAYQLSEQGKTWQDHGTGSSVAPVAFGSCAHIVFFFFVINGASEEK